MQPKFLNGRAIYRLPNVFLHGTTEISKLSRQKIKDTLARNKPLQMMISDSMSEDNGQISFSFDPARLENFIVKLAKGHAKFEHSQPRLNKPTHFSVRPLPTLSDEELNSFLETQEITKWPEVGSRAMIKIVEGKIPHSRWIEVQAEKYAYQVVLTSEGTSVKIIIHNYLMVEAIWA